MFQQSKKEIILKEEIEENTLAIYLEDEPINYIPEKDSGYTLDLTKSSCTNGVEISFDYNTWSVKTNYSNYNSENNQRVKCSLYFKKRTFAEAVVDCGALNKDGGTCIKENYSLTSEIVDDETSDNNLRFIGANPNNYVWFNDELWRIIGVMNSIDDGTGKKETRLKIIREESIGQYSWDYDSNGSYDNDWTNSTLMNLLNNEAYYNRTTGMYYNNSASPITVDFRTIGLTNEAKTMIGNAMWNLGGLSSYYNNTITFYIKERSTEVYNGHAITWIGKVGLIYPSDYGYATNGGSTIDRSSCLGIDLINWNVYSYCGGNNWLGSSYQWTITQLNSFSITAFNINSYSQVSYNDVNLTDYHVSPSVYLNSNVKITGGDGSSSNPFNLTII